MRQLPDCSMLTGYRSALFVLRQPFLLAPSVLATLGVGALLFSAMAARGKTAASDIVPMLVIVPLVGIGLTVLTVLPAFLLACAFRAKLEFEPHEGEVLLEQQKASHWLGDESRGGKLFITDRRLVFVPHRFNVQRARAEQRLSAIRDVRWARVHGANGRPLSCILEVAEENRVERYLVKDARSFESCFSSAAPVASGSGRPNDNAGA